MNQKTIWTITALVVCVAVVSYVVISGVGQPAPRVSITTTNQPGVPVPPTPVGGIISAVTPTSITLTPQGGQPHTFAISASTPVMSVVAAGQIGKSASQLAVGTNIFVFPVAGDPNTARSITVPPPMPPKPAAGTTVATLSGKVSAVSTGSMTLTLTDNTTKKVLLTSKTIILSNVFAGQKGKGLSDLKGSQVQVLGTSSNGTVTAQIILIIQ